MNHGPTSHGPTPHGKLSLLRLPQAQPPTAWDFMEPRASA